MSQKGLSFGSQLLYTISSEVVIIRKVELTMNEQAKYEAIKKLSESGGNKKAVAIKLGCTLRHVNRMLKGYQAQGKAYFSPEFDSGILKDAEISACLTIL